jgi:SAM-dependent methyltransferase
MVKSSKSLKKSEDKGSLSNQFLTLASGQKKDIEKLLSKLSHNKEFEFIFRSNKRDMLNRESYISLLKLINIIDKTNDKYHTEGPHEMLDVNLRLNDSDVYRITINNTTEKDYIKIAYNNLVKKSSNYSIFKMLLYLAKKSKDTKRYNIMKKIREADNTIDMEEFDVRVRLSDEIDMFDNILKGKTGDLPDVIKRMMKNEEFSYEEIKELNKKISFRYKERTSLFFYQSSDAKSYVKMDLTYTKNTRTLNRLNHTVPDHELELEVIGDKITDTLRDTAFDSMEKILKMLQQSNYIVSNSVKENVVNTYKNTMISADTEKITSLDSRQAVSLEIQHVTEILPNKYAVTDKADGDRYFLIIVNDSVYLLSPSLQVKDTGIVLDKAKGKKYNGTVLDGEYIFIAAHNRHMFMAFDCLAIGSEDIRREQDFMKRLARADEVIANCFVFEGQKGFDFTDVPSMKGDFNIDAIVKHHKGELKRFYQILNEDLKVNIRYPLVRRKYFINVFGAKKWEIFKYSGMFWDSYTKDNETPFPYLLDGLVYHPLEQTYTTNVADSKFLEYKWKPQSKNSIDFYIEFKKDPITGKSVPVYDNTNPIQNKTYKICNLYAGKMIKGKEYPVPFNENGASGEAYIFLDNGEARDIDGDIISDKTVVEFCYKDDPELPENHRWIPIRTRHDKTEFVERYRRRYGNYHTIATRIWRSIVNPVTMSDINDLAVGGNKYNDKIQELNNRIEHNLIVSVTRENKYYQKITKLAKTMRSFHNWIKSNVIYTYCHYMYKSNKQQSVLDIGCGRGGDNMKFYYSEVAYYVGLDLDQDNLLSPVDGAVSRYNQMRKKKPNFPRMYFIQADLRALLTYEDQIRALSGMTTDNKNLINKFFPMDSRKKTQFDIVNCQFAVHYFMESQKSWDNFKMNINNHLRAGGFLILTTFNGHAVREALKGKEKYTEYYTDDTGNKRVLFDVVKRYDDDVKPGVGIKIDFHAAWMFKEDTYFSEYIVDKEFLEQDLLDDCELELIDFDMFKNQFELHRDYLTNYSKYQPSHETRQFLQTAGSYYEDSELNKGCQGFTNLNCYYVFRKKDTYKSKGGGKFDFSDSELYNIPAMRNYNDEFSFLNSIHNVLKSHKLIPKNIKVDELFEDLDIDIMKDIDLSHKDMKKICKKTIINHDIGEGSQSRMKTVLDGLNIALVERDCNDHYDIEYVTNKKRTKKGDKFIVLMKEGHLYKPIYDNENKTGIYRYGDDMVDFILGMGDQI